MLVVDTSHRFASDLNITKGEKTYEWIKWKWNSSNCGSSD